MSAIRQFKRSSLTSKLVLRQYKHAWCAECGCSEREVMKTCSKSTIFALTVLSTLFFILVLVNYRSDPEDIYLTLIDEESLQNSYQGVGLANRIVDKNISYLLQPNFCTEEQQYVFIITSYYSNVESRSSIRKAFRELDIPLVKSIKRVFLLGRAPSDMTKQSSIINEHIRFKDILQGNFVESYKNLTYKHLMGLKFASFACSKVKYIVKMDDDIVLNLRRTVEFLEGTKLPKTLLAGFVMKQMPVIREHRSKWYVKPEEFGESVYPNFLSGWFYVTNVYTARFLLRAANEFDYFWIDDAFITGIAARKLGIKHFDIRKHFFIDPRHTYCCYKDLVEDGLDCEFIAAPNGGDNNLFFKMNKVLEKCHKNGCKTREKTVNETCKVDFENFNVVNGKPFIENFNLVK